MVTAQLKTVWHPLLAVVWLTSLGAAGAVAQENAVAVQEDPSASLQLLNSALKFELAGENDYRQFALKAALREDPDFEPARWYLGMLQVDGQWVAADELPRVTSRDAYLDEYRQRRLRSLGRAAAELGLARWCRQFGLEAQARTHFRRVQQGVVSASQSQRDEAIRELGLLRLGDQWLTPEQLDKLQEAEETKSQARQSWARATANWREDLQGSNAQRRAQALEEIRQVRDETAIEWMESRLSLLSVDAAEAVVTALAKIDDEEATGSLVRHAVHVSWSEVSDAASRALSERPLHEYVPILLTALEQPLEERINVRMLGSSRSVARIDLPLREREELEKLQRLVQTRSRGRVTQRQANRARQLQARIETLAQARSQRYQLQLQRENDRIFRILAVATGEILRQDVLAWRNWWEDYNDVYRPDQPETIFVSARQTTLQSPGSLTSSGFSIPGVYRQYNPECFRAGTLVWTDLGTVPIESIQPGDRVVAQDVDTGELALRSVLEVTVRPDSRMMRVTVNGREIVSTLGHPFWVNGRGWTMARELESGMQVHTLEGSLLIDAAIRLPEREPAYNLIVEDFGSYFVTEQAILVHDGSDRKSPRRELPGLPVKAR